MTGPPDETIEPLTAEAPGRTAATWVLRICIAGMCVGYAAKVSSDGGAHFLSLITEFFDSVPEKRQSLPHHDGQTSLVTSFAVGALLFLACAFLLFPHATFTLTLAIGFAFAVGVLWVDQIGGWHRGWTVEDYYGALRPGSWAPRYLGPLAVFLLWSGVSNMRRYALASLILRVAAAGTFAAHGFKAVTDDSGMNLLIVNTFANIGVDVAPLQAALALKVIGAVDIIIAALVLVTPWRPVVAWMAFWGFLAAFSRMTAHGWDWWYETAIRLPNGGVPLALLCLWWWRSRGDGEAVEKG